MIKNLLVAASGDTADTPTYEAAVPLARRLGAHLDVLHVRYDSVGTAVAMATDMGGGALAGGVIDQLDADAQAREASARQNFARYCGDAGAGGVAAAFHVETGDESRWLAAYARAADLVVALRPAAAGASRGSLEAVLLDSGRPLLLAPASPMPAALERVAIAWKPTAEAARAVALAMPLLATATEVVVVTIDEGTDSPDDAARLVRNLARHGIPARAESLPCGPDGAAATLLGTVAGRADLLVMGGFGHSQLREWIFGGFTESILADAPLPVLIAH